MQGPRQKNCDGGSAARGWGRIEHPKGRYGRPRVVGIVLLFSFVSVAAWAQDKYDRRNTVCLSTVEERRGSTCAQLACKTALACDFECTEKYADDTTPGTYESCRAKCWDTQAKAAKQCK